jgi:hypothetical protein
MTLGATVGVTMLSNQIGSNQTNKDLNMDYLGSGQAGHSFAIDAQERTDTIHDEQQTMIRGGLIAAGSLFGPEGLAVGTMAAGLSSVFDSGPPAAMIADTAGGQIPSTDVI